eukprot:3270699-Alexandrium_andersonii.AAC.1
MANLALHPSRHTRPPRGAVVAQAVISHPETVEPCVMTCTLKHNTVVLRQPKRLRPSLSKFFACHRRPRVGAR